MKYGLLNVTIWYSNCCVASSLELRAIGQINIGFNNHVSKKELF